MSEIIFGFKILGFFHKLPSQSSIQYLSHRWEALGCHLEAAKSLARAWRAPGLCLCLHHVCVYVYFMFKTENCYLQGAPNDLCPTGAPKNWKLLPTGGPKRPVSYRGPPKRKTVTHRGPPTYQNSFSICRGPRKRKTVTHRRPITICVLQKTVIFPLTKIVFFHLQGPQKRKTVIHRGPQMTFYMLI